MADIFISYRRSDMQYVAWQVHRALADVFRPENVFLDVTHIEKGDDFRKIQLDAVRAAKVVLVVIGDRWLDARDSHGCRRLDDSTDNVRLEIETALTTKGVTVIPLFVHPVMDIPAEKLPASLEPLAARNGHHIRPLTDFDSDIAHLVENVRGRVPLTKQRTTRSPDPRDDLKNLIIDHGLSADLLGGESPSLLECVQATRACYLPVADKNRPVVEGFHYNHFFGPSTVIFIESPAMKEPSLLWYPRIVRAGEPENMSRKGWSILFHGSFKFHVVRENCPMDEWVQLALRNRERATASFLNVPDGTLFALIDYKVRLPPVSGMSEPFAIITRDLRKSESRVYTQYVFRTTVRLPEATTMEAVNSVLATFETPTDAPLSFVPADVNHDYFLTPAESGKLMDYLAFRGLYNTERTKVCKGSRFTRTFRLL